VLAILEGILHEREETLVNNFAIWGKGPMFKGRDLETQGSSSVEKVGRSRMSTRKAHGGYISWKRAVIEILIKLEERSFSS